MLNKGTKGNHLLKRKISFWETRLCVVEQQDDGCFGLVWLCGRLPFVFCLAAILDFEVGRFAFLQELWLVAKQLLPTTKKWSGHKIAISTELTNKLK